MPSKDDFGSGTRKYPARRGPKPGNDDAAGEGSKRTRKPVDEAEARDANEREHPHRDTRETPSPHP